MQTDLDERVRALLAQHRGGWPALANELGVSRSWISQFCRRRITNPRYQTLVRLHAHLSVMTGIERRGSPPARVGSRAALPGAVAVVHPGVES